MEIGEQAGELADPVCLTKGPSTWSSRSGRHSLRGQFGRGSFGLVQQFGPGVYNVDLDAAADKGVWVANEAGLNAEMADENS